MPVKCQVRFSLFNDAWSENLFLNKSITNTAALTSQAQELTNLRKAFLAPGCWITGVRFSDIDNPRRVFNVVQNIAGAFPPFAVIVGLGGGTSVAEQPDMPWTAVLTRFTGVNGERTNIWVRGLPDGVTKYAAGIITDSSFVNPYNSWKSYIRTNAFQMRVLDPAANPPFLISNVTIVSGKIRLTILGHPYINNQLIKISQFVSDPPINGKYRILKIDADTIELMKSNTALTAIPFDAGGRVVSQIMHMVDIAKIEQVKFSKKNPGRPFDLPRGKGRKVKKKLPSALMG